MYEKCKEPYLIGVFTEVSVTVKRIRLAFFFALEIDGSCDLSARAGLLGIKFPLESPER